MTRAILLKLLSASVLLITTCVGAQVSVPTQHNNNNRTGENRQEPWLNTSNVNVSNFGKLFALPVDGNIYAQPLYVPGLAIGGKTRNVVYVATEHNSVYAFDADDPTALAPLWHVTPTILGTSVPSGDVCIGLSIAECPYKDLVPEIGITGTPVIDPASSTIYVVAKSKNTSNNTYHFKLHALDLITGAEKFGGPVEVTAPGFNVLFHLNHPGLLLANGRVYLGFGSLGDIPSWHGWLMAYDAATLQQKAVFNASPSSSEGSIWQGGQGPVADNAGNVYVATGNGPFDITTGGSAYGDSILRLNGSSLSVLDYFTPDDQSSLSSNDADLGSGGPILLPGTNVLVSAGKDGWIRVMDTGNLGKFNATFDADLQEWQVFSGQFIGAPVYWSSSTFGPLLYTYGPADVPNAFRFNGSSFQTSPVSVGTIPNVAGDASNAALAVSSNGDTPGSGILWAAASASGDPAHSPMAGILRAFDATNLANELWDSNQNSARDKPGSYAKYVSPVIANGKVYLATVSGEVAVYGLLAPPDFTLEAAPGSSSVTAGGTVTYTLSVIPQSGFNTTVSLSCSGPTGVGISCRVDSSVAPTGAPATAKLSATTTGPAAALKNSRHILPLYATFLLLPAIFLQTWRAPQNRKLRHTLNCVAIVLLFMVASCGGGGTSKGPGGVGVTPAGTYTVKVSGSSGSLSRTTAVTLTVQ